jgi:hypothetical protein
MRRHVLHCWAVLLSLVPVAATSQGVKRTAPMPEQIAGLAFAGIEKSPVLLRQGVWEGKPVVPGSSSHARVELIQDFRLVGDLNGDGMEEAAVLPRGRLAVGCSRARPSMRRR